MKKNKIFQKINNLLGKVNEKYWAWFYKKAWPIVQKFCNSIEKFAEMYDELPRSFVQRVLLLFDVVLFTPFLVLGVITTRNPFGIGLLLILIICVLIVARKVKKEYLDFKNKK